MNNIAFTKDVGLLLNITINLVKNALTVKQATSALKAVLSARKIDYKRPEIADGFIIKTLYPKRQRITEKMCNDIISAIVLKKHFPEQKERNFWMP
ncbi:hypothetical protein SPFM1_00052 [Salmonella phage SPFM1]|nr:hypothetical protein SPFM1_00052 [Salmonella phage SPFM1]